METPCDWNTPGADRYTGTVAAAVMAYGLPLATQQALIAAFERREFADSVVIDRDTIRGKAHEYDPGIRDMHFGSAGRVCAWPARSRWQPEHVETALVVCADGECIGWPAVCGNVFRLTRLVGRHTTMDSHEPAAGGIPARDEQTSVGTGERLAGNDPWTADAPGEPGWRSWPEPPSAPAHGSRAPVSAVPESSTWALILAGLALVLHRRRR